MLKVCASDVMLTRDHDADEADDALWNIVIDVRCLCYLKKEKGRFILFDIPIYEFESFRSAS